MVLQTNLACSSCLVNLAVCYLIDFSHFGVQIPKTLSAPGGCGSSQSISGLGACPLLTRVRSTVCQRLAKQWALALATGGSLYLQPAGCLMVNFLQFLILNCFGTGPRTVARIYSRSLPSRACSSAGCGQTQLGSDSKVGMAFSPSCCTG